MKNIVLFSIMILTVSILYATDIKNYDLTLVDTISTGNREGEIGDTIPLKNMGGLPPNNFYISVDNKIYVCDFMNQRINIYDINFQFLKFIKEKQQSKIYNSDKFIIDKNGKIIAYIGTIGLVKVDQDGNEIFRINKADLPGEVRYNQIFFILDDYILYYDNDLINIINQNGEKLKQDEVGDILNYFNSLSDEQSTREINPQKNKDLKETIDKNKIVTYKEKIITKNFQDLIDFNNSYAKILNNKNISGSENTNFENILNELTNIKNIKLIDYDLEGNSYWRSFTKNKIDNKYVILVCSKNGDIIDCFYNELSLPNVAIAPNGDVYFMDRKPKDGKFLFYKIPRQW